MAKTVANVSDFPQKEHWAVLTYSYVTVPGYDKGDPDEIRNITEYIPFKTKEEMEQWVSDTVRREGKNFSVLHVTPANVKTTVTVEIK